MWWYCSLKSTLITESPASASVEQSLPIMIQFFTGLSVDTQWRFEYRNNSSITDLQPRQHLIRWLTFVNIVSWNTQFTSCMFNSDSCKLRLQGLLVNNILVKRYISHAGIAGKKVIWKDGDHYTSEHDAKFWKANSLNWHSCSLLSFTDTNQSMYLLLLAKELNLIDLIWYVLRVCITQGRPTFSSFIFETGILNGNTHRHEPALWTLMN